MIKHEFLCVTTNFYKELSAYMIYEKAMLKDSHFYCVESYSVKKKEKIQRETSFIKTIN